MSQYTCPCGRVTGGDLPTHGKCLGCGTPYVTLQIDIKTICTCCNGSGSYQPLIGPPEPCGTCKGEKYIAEKPKDEILQRVPQKRTPFQKAAEFAANYGGMNYDMLGNAFFKTSLGKPWTPMEERQSESRIHRKGSVTGDINITYTTKNTNQDAIDNLLRSFYRQLEDLGAKVEGFKASVGQDKIVLHNDDDGSLHTTWHHKPRYDVAAFISDEGCPMDFAAIERHVMEKQAMMQLEVYKAMTSAPPLFYDPKTGKISNGQSD